MAGKKQADKVWAVQFGDREYDVRDLPVGIVNTIAHDNHTTWMEVLGAPLYDFGVAEAVVRAVAAQIGPDAVIPEPLTAKTLTPLFVLVDDDLPEPEDVPGDPPTGPAT